MSDSRKRFEEWVKSKWGLVPQKDESGEYMTTIVHHWFNGWSARDSEVERLREALEGLLALPIASTELAYLDRGIGVATQNAAWLRARAALSSQDKESA